MRVNHSGYAPARSRGVSGRVVRLVPGRRRPVPEPRPIVPVRGLLRSPVLRRLGRLDRWAFDRVAAARLPGLEYVLPRLSRFADHGVLWFTAAGAMGLTGRPQLRRAALRGSIAIAVASPAVNLLGKQAFRRKRPVVDLVPPMRIRWKLPTSHAFPSGHSASAAAFAAGVAMEAPRAVAVPVAATAAAVAFSRVYTGAHYPGDVLAGLGIGACAALGTRMVRHARPPAARVARAEDIGGPVHDDGRGVIAVVNPGSGTADGEGATGILPGRAEIAIELLLRRELPAAEIVTVGPDDDVDKAFGEAAGRAAVLAVIGGDGTVNAAARAALDHRVPLLVVPGGTFDHFARALGLESAADAIAAYRDGRLGRVDVAYAAPAGGSAHDEHLFLNTAGLGAYPELIDRRERLQGRLGKWPALAVAAVRTLRHCEPVDLVVDGRGRRVWLAFVGNCGYGSRGAAPTWRERLDDGRLDIRMIATGRRVPRVRAVAAILAGHLHVTPGYRAWTSSGLEVVSREGDLRVARDGEVSSLPGALRFGKHARALAVFCPAAAIG